MHRTDIATLELVKHCYSILMITKPNVENLWETVSWSIQRGLTD